MGHFIPWLLYATNSGGTNVSAAARIANAVALEKSGAR